MLCLSELWTRKIGGSIEALTYDDNGNLGVASNDGCAYIFDSDGNLLNKICGDGWMNNASYSNGRFGFINWDGYAYITDENGNLMFKVYVGDDYTYAITMTSNGFVACGYRCAFFDFDGDKLWDVDVGEVDNGPVRHKGYWYMADGYWGKLLIVKGGKIIKEINYGEDAYATAVCDKYLAVSTYSHLYLYDLNNPANPKEIWKVGGFKLAYRVVFDPNCKCMVVADTGNHKLKVYSAFRIPVYKKYYGSSNNDEVWSLAYWRDRMAVGLYDGRICVYKVIYFHPTLVVKVTKT